MPTMENEKGPIANNGRKTKKLSENQSWTRHKHRAALTQTLSEQQVASSMRTVEMKMLSYWEAAPVLSCSSPVLDLQRPHLSCSSLAHSLACPENAAHSKEDTLFKLTLTVTGSTVTTWRQSCCCAASCYKNPIQILMWNEPNSVLTHLKFEGNLRPNWNFTCLISRLCLFRVLGTFSILSDTLLVLACTQKMLWTCYLREIHFKSAHVDGICSYVCRDAANLPCSVTAQQS